MKQWLYRGELSVLVQVQDTPSSIMARAYVSLQESAIGDADAKIKVATSVALQQYGPCLLLLADKAQLRPMTLPALTACRLNDGAWPHQDGLASCCMRLAHWLTSAY